MTTAERVARHYEEEERQLNETRRVKEQALTEQRKAETSARQKVEAVKVQRTTPAEQKAADEVEQAKSRKPNTTQHRRKLAENEFQLKGIAESPKPRGRLKSVDPRRIQIEDVDDFPPPKKKPPPLPPRPKKPMPEALDFPLPPFLKATSSEKRALPSPRGRQLPPLTPEDLELFGNIPLGTKQRPELRKSPKPNITMGGEKTVETLPPAPTPTAPVVNTEALLAGAAALKKPRGRPKKQLGLASLDVLNLTPEKLQSLRGSLAPTPPPPQYVAPETPLTKGVREKSKKLRKTTPPPAPTPTAPEPVRNPTPEPEQVVPMLGFAQELKAVSKVVKQKRQTREEKEKATQEELDAEQARIWFQEQSDRAQRDFDKQQLVDKIKELEQRLDTEPNQRRIKALETELTRTSTSLTTMVSDQQEQNTRLLEQVASQSAALRKVKGEKSDTESALNRQLRIAKEELLQERKELESLRANLQELKLKVPLTAEEEFSGTTEEGSRLKLRLGELQKRAPELRKAPPPSPSQKEPRSPKEPPAPTPTAPTPAPALPAVRPAPKAKTARPPAPQRRSTDLVIQPVERAPSPERSPKTVEDMTIPEMKAYALAKGIKGLSSKTEAGKLPDKAEILRRIRAFEGGRSSIETREAVVKEELSKGKSKDEADRLGFFAEKLASTPSKAKRMEILVAQAQFEKDNDFDKLTRRLTQIEGVQESTVDEENMRRLLGELNAAIDEGDDNEMRRLRESVIRLSRNSSSSVKDFGIRELARSESRLRSRASSRDSSIDPSRSRSASRDSEYDKLSPDEKEQFIIQKALAKGHSRQYAESAGFFAKRAAEATTDAQLEQIMAARLRWEGKNAEETERVRAASREKERPPPPKLKRSESRDVSPSVSLDDEEVMERLRQSSPLSKAPTPRGARPPSAFRDQRTPSALRAIREESESGPRRTLKEVFAEKKSSREATPEPLSKLDALELAAFTPTPTAPKPTFRRPVLSAETVLRLSKEDVSQPSPKGRVAKQPEYTKAPNKFEPSKRVSKTAEIEVPVEPVGPPVSVKDLESLESASFVAPKKRAPAKPTGPAPKPKARDQSPRAESPASKTVYKQPAPSSFLNQNERAGFKTRLLQNHDIDDDFADRLTTIASKALDKPESERNAYFKGALGGDFKGQLITRSQRNAIDQTKLLIDALAEASRYKTRGTEEPKTSKVVSISGKTPTELSIEMVQRALDLGANKEWAESAGKLVKRVAEAPVEQRVKLSKDFTNPYGQGAEFYALAKVLDQLIGEEEGTTALGLKGGALSDEEDDTYDGMPPNIDAIFPSLEDEMEPDDVERFLLIRPNRTITRGEAERLHNILLTERARQRRPPNRREVKRIRELELEDEYEDRPPYTMEETKKPRRKKIPDLLGVVGDLSDEEPKEEEPRETDEMKVVLTPDVVFRMFGFRVNRDITFGQAGRIRNLLDGKGEATTEEERRFMIEVGAVAPTDFYEDEEGKEETRQQEEKDGNEGKGLPCWKGYEMIGMKMKKGRKVPNCVPRKFGGDLMMQGEDDTSENGYGTGSDDEKEYVKTKSNGIRMLHPAMESPLYFRHPNAQANMHALQGGLLKNDLQKEYNKAVPKSLRPAVNELGMASAKYVGRQLKPKANKVYHKVVPKSLRPAVGELAKDTGSFLKRQMGFGLGYGMDGGLLRDDLQKGYNKAVPKSLRPAVNELGMDTAKYVGRQLKPKAEKAYHKAVPKSLRPAVGELAKDTGSFLKRKMGFGLGSEMDGMEGMGAKKYAKEALKTYVPASMRKGVKDLAKEGARELYDSSGAKAAMHEAKEHYGRAKEQYKEVVPKDIRRSLSELGKASLKEGRKMSGMGHSPLNPTDIPHGTGMKGSPEMKEKMARLRAMRKKKMNGGMLDAEPPRSRSYTTNPELSGGELPPRSRTPVDDDILYHMKRITKR